MKVYEKANEVIKTIENGSLRGEVSYDVYVENPRQSFDCLGTLITRGKYEHLSEIELDYSDCNSWEDEEKVIKKEFGKDCIIVPLYAYIHGDISISTAPFSCRFDSGRLGSLVVSKEDIQKEFSCKNLTTKVKEKAVKIVRHELSQLESYLNGEVYIIRMYDGEDTEEIDYVCNVYSMEDAEEIIKDLFVAHSK